MEVEAAGVGVIATFAVVCAVVLAGGAACVVVVHVAAERARRRDESAAAGAAGRCVVVALDPMFEEIEFDISGARGWSADDVIYTLAQIEAL